MKSVRLIIATVAAAALVPLSATAAFAAPPGNDTPDGAIALTLGDTVNQDTSQATTDKGDAKDNRFCGAPFTNASVWYSYTPAADGSFILDMSQSDYSGGFMVFQGSPSPRHMIGCGPTTLGLHGTGGQLYTIMVFSDTPTNGGNLVLSLQQGPPPPTISVTIDKAGQVFKNGTAQVSGTFTCSDTLFLNVSGQLTQIWRRVKITGDFRAGAHANLCDGQAHPWTKVVKSHNGLFAAGDSVVFIRSTGCGQIDCTQVKTRGHVKLTAAGSQAGTAVAATRSRSTVSTYARPLRQHWHQ